MTVVARTRYQDAQTVSDELGKGAEVLRQQVISVHDLSGGNNTINIHCLYAEVDIILRYIRVMCVEVPDANADLTFNRNRQGTLTALASAVALDGLTTEIFSEVTLTQAIDVVKQDDSIYAVLVRDASSTQDGDIGVYLGWMPDLYTPGGVPRTF